MADTEGDQGPEGEPDAGPLELGLAAKPRQERVEVRVEPEDGPAVRAEEALGDRVVEPAEQGVPVPRRAEQSDQSGNVGFSGASTFTVTDPVLPP